MLRRLKVIGGKRQYSRRVAACLRMDGSYDKIESCVNLCTAK